MDAKSTENAQAENVNENLCSSVDSQFEKSPVNSRECDRIVATDSVNNPITVESTDKRTPSAKPDVLNSPGSHVASNPDASSVQRKTWSARLR